MVPDNSEWDSRMTEQVPVEDCSRCGGNPSPINHMIPEGPDRFICLPCAEEILTKGGYFVQFNKENSNDQKCKSV